MLDPIAPAVPPPLGALLQAASAGLDDSLVAAARALPPDAAARALEAVLHDELARPAADGAAIRAAHLAAELRLPAVLPSLLLCLEVLPDAHPLGRAAQAAVARFGELATAPLRGALLRCRRDAARRRLEEALDWALQEDDVPVAALVQRLATDPTAAARGLAERGAWRAIPDLLRTFDRLVADPIADCVVCEAQQLCTIASAVRTLGGRLSEAQRVRIDDALDRSEAAWTLSSDDAAPLGGGPVVRAGPRPGRNDPCPCGSGKKYKRCCLGREAAPGRH